MWLRLFTISCSVGFFALLAWMGTHRSEEPAVLGRYSSGYFLLLVALACVATVSLLAHLPSIHRRLLAARNEIALLLVSILASVTMLEAVIRAIDPLGVSYFEEVTRYHLDKVPDPVLVYRHAPHLARTYQGVRVSTNELGFRDRNLEGKQNGELRIMLLGDSVTFGWGVPVEATFARRLEGHLASRLGRPVTTVNTGVGSYNTVQEHAVLKTYAQSVDPDLVVLVYVENDIVPNDPPFDPWLEVSLKAKSPPQAIQVLLGKSWLYRLGHFLHLRYRSSSTSLASLDRNARGVTGSMHALGEIAAFCRKHGIGFVTFFYRSTRGPLTRSAADLLSEVRASGREHGFCVVDVGAWWITGDARAVMNSTVDSHPNARGHEILSNEIANFLLTQGLADGVTPRCQ
jgi:GDSL-like Lipase/Acylhydrolase family